MVFEGAGGYFGTLPFVDWWFDKLGILWSAVSKVGELMASPAPNWLRSVFKGLSKVYDALDMVTLNPFLEPVKDSLHWLVEKMNSTAVAGLIIEFVIAFFVAIAIISAFLKLLSYIT